MTALRVCFVGDSITLGTNDDTGLGWPGRLAQRERRAGHDVTAYNLGIRADTSELIEPRWRAECAARLPDVAPGALVFGFGINDTADQEGLGIRVPAEKSLAIAGEMLSQAKAWKPTLWVGPTPADGGRQPFRPAPGLVFNFDNGRIAEISDAYAELASDLEIPYLDLFTPLSSDANWPGVFAGDDGVHPTATGYAMIAERVAGWDAWRAWFV